MNRVRSGMQLNWSEVQDEMRHKITVVVTPTPELAYQAAATNIPMVIKQPFSMTAKQFEKLASAITEHILL